MLHSAMLAALLLTLPTTPSPAPQPRDPSLPPSAEQAKAALDASPRHGEYVDVPVSGGPALKTWISYPERKDKAGIVIVIQEVFGLTDWLRGVADQLAQGGLHRRRARHGVRPRAQRRRHGLGGEPRRRRRARAQALADGRRRAAERGARLGPEDPVRPTAGSRRSASAGAAATASRMPASSRRSPPPSSSTACRRKLR